MSRNLSRIANHDSKREAINDYVYVSLKAIGLGRNDIVDANPVKTGYGWRRIDRCTAAIRAEFGWPLVYEMREQDAQVSA